MSSEAVIVVTILCGVIGYVVGNFFTQDRGGLTAGRSATIAAVVALVAGILYISTSVLFLLPFNNILGGAIVVIIVIVVLVVLNSLRMRRA